jgi:two-component system, NarL family, sensor histidine kinase LiaS
MGIRPLFLLVCASVSVFSSLILLLVLVHFSDLSFVWTDVPWIASTIVVCGVAAIWVAYRVAQSIRRRLYALEEAASLIAAGRLHHRVDSLGDTDEIGRLIEQFNNMGAKLEQQVRLLQQLADENQALAAEADQVAALRERQMLARDLHDSVSQQLFALSMMASSAQRQYETAAPSLAQTLHQMETLAGAAQREMRALLLHLRPIDLQGRDFYEAVTTFLAAVQERHQLVCSFQASVRALLSVSVEEQLFRILQEAVANVLKHAEASAIDVRVTQDGPVLTLVVMDNGKGIPENRGDGVRDSYGLRAMEERAVSLGGRLELWRRSKGTAVEVHIPIVERERDGE